MFDIRNCSINTTTNHQPTPHQNEDEGNAKENLVIYGKGSSLIWVDKKRAHDSNYEFLISVFYYRLKCNVKTLN